jgi:hypothetical protein
MTLRIFIAGRERLAAPYYGDTARDVAALIREFMPDLRAAGRVAIFVDCGKVAHLVAGAR